MSDMGLWHCPECGQQWEIHGVAGNLRARRVSRIGSFLARLLGS